MAIKQNPALHMTAKEAMESPDTCPFCEADAMDVDVNNDDEGYCCKCNRSWKIERRFVGYSYTDEEGEYHEVTEEQGDRIATLEEQVRILREALESVASVALEGDKGRKAKREYEERDSEDTLCAKVRIARAALEAAKLEGA
jgi:hypothetical protein